MRKLSLLAVALLLLVFTAVPVFAQGTVLDIAAATPELSTLVAAVQAADPSVAAALAGDGPITVFAPTNTAFANLDAFLSENYGTSLAAVLENTEVLSNLLRYHVVAGELFSGQLADLNDQTIPTVQGGAIGVTVGEDGTITLNSVADVVAADINASNGVVHLIDQVILPGAIIAQLEEAAAAAAEPAGFTSLRVAHFAGDQRSVDVYVNGERLLQGAQYGDVTPWSRVPSGTYEIAVTNSGGQVDNAIIGPLTVELQPNRWVTIAATGLRANGSLTAQVVAQILPDLDEGEAHVTVLHAIPDAPAVDVLAGEDALTQNLFYPNTFSARVPEGTYDLSVVTSVAGSDVVLADLPGTEIAGLTYYFVAAYGSAAEPQVFVDAISAEDVARINSGQPLEEGAAAEGEETAAAEGEAEATETPSEETAAEGTIADLVIASTEADPAEFTILRALIEAADPAILETLAGEGPVTVFAPTDAAFEVLLEALGVDAETAAGQTDLVNQVLLYHVIEGAVSAEDVIALDGESVETLHPAGESIQVAVVDGGVVLNGSVNVVETDIQASNGVVHIIDAVLIPPSVAMLLGL